MLVVETGLKSHFHCEPRIEYSLFLLLIFPRLKSKQALSEAKISIKQAKNTPFHARSGNEPLSARHWGTAHLLIIQAAGCGGYWVRQVRQLPWAPFF